MSTTATKIKPASGQSTTMYEVDGDYDHTKQFYDFICSLGFDAHKKYESAGLDTHMVIDEEEFYVNFEKTSPTAKNGWTRDVHPRKDRCIEIMDRHLGSIIVKVRFNEEIDRDKLIAKIQKAVNEKKAWTQEIVDRKDNEMKMLTLMRDHYYSSPIVSAHTESIMAHEGVLHFQIKGATIKVDASTGTFTGFEPYEERENGSTVKITDIMKWASEKADIAKRANAICSELKGMKAVGKEFSEYAKSAYHRYVRKDKIEER